MTSICASGQAPLTRLDRTRCDSRWGTSGVAPHPVSVSFATPDCLARTRCPHRAGEGGAWSCGSGSVQRGDRGNASHKPRYRKDACQQIAHQARSARPCPTGGSRVRVRDGPSRTAANPDGSEQQAKPSLNPGWLQEDHSRGLAPDLDCNHLRPIISNLGLRTLADALEDHQVARAGRPAGPGPRIS
jgi:hypothetical protein